MAGRKSKSREDRVFSLLNEIGRKLEKEDAQMCYIEKTYDSPVRNVMSQTELTRSMSAAVLGSKKNIKPTTGYIELTADPRKDRPWTSATTGRKMSKESRSTIGESKQTVTHNIATGDNTITDISDQPSDSCISGITSLRSTSSKVQQLRLFWDKFFLMETEGDRSDELTGKKSALSVAKCRIADKPKSKSMRKSAAKFLEKAIPPTRCPISFRMITSQQKQNSLNAKRRLIKDQSCSELNLAVSREVSTYMGKLPLQNTDSETNSETESVYTLAENVIDQETISTQRNNESTVKQESDDVKSSDSLKKLLFNIFLVEQSEVDSQETNKKEKYQGAFRLAGLDIQIGCALNKGFIILLRFHHFLMANQEIGVVIRTDEAVIITSSVAKIKKRERKLRKQTTLLPCYYYSIQQDNPVDIMSFGDSFVDDSKNITPIEKKNSDHLRRVCDIRKLLSYERVTFDTNAIMENKTKIKLIISNGEPYGKIMFHFLIGFTSALFIALAVVMLKFIQYIPL